MDDDGFVDILNTVQDIEDAMQDDEALFELGYQCISRAIMNTDDPHQLLDWQQELVDLEASAQPPDPQVH